MSDSRIQADRVLAAMAKAGRAGITQVDFDLPNVCDGLAPIKWVAARIHDLEHKRGVVISRNGRRHKCCVYVLADVMSGAGASTAIPERGAAVTGVGPALALDITEALVPGQLDPDSHPNGAGDSLSAPCAIYDPWEDAA